MRSVVLMLVLGMTLAPHAAGPATAAERRLTLDEAVRLGLQRNEGLLIERESLAAARAGVTAAKGAYDPLLTLDGGWGRSTEPVNSSFSGAPAGRSAPENEAAEGGMSIQQLLPTGGALSVHARGARGTTDGSLALLSPAYDTRVGVELRQPLLRDRSTDAARLSVRVATASREGAAASLRRTVSETVAAVEQAYWSLVAARLAIQVRQEAVELAGSQLTETETRVQAGSVPRTGLAEPRAELERRRGELLAAREASARAENALKRLILSGADDALWADSLAPVEDAAVEIAPVDVAASLARALANRSELGIAEAIVARRRAETAFARDGVWPSLDAVVSYERFGLAGSPNPAGPGGSLPAGLRGDLGDSFESLGRGDLDAARVAVELGLPLFNRTARGNAAAARAFQRQAEADLARVRKAIRAEVLDAAAALETAGQRIEAARLGREAAEVQLSAERDRFASGMSTNFLVLTRQNDLSRARLDEISALTDYRAARTEMARATGALAEGVGQDGMGTGR
jgi:HAE1 family hydrophobic/amphiphilic exporter-1